jgi:hypothetical protein
MTQMNQEAEHAKDVMAQIDEYLGTTPARSGSAKEPVKVERTQAAKKNGSVLHVMYDVKEKEIIGASIGGKVIAGAVAINMSREGISVYDSEGQDLLGTTKAAVGDSRATRIQQDIIDWLNGGGE